MREVTPGYGPLLRKTYPPMALSINGPILQGPEGQESGAVAHSARQNPDART